MAINQQIGQRSIFDLGKSMKDYGLAQIISLAFGFISSIIMYFMFLPLTLTDPETMSLMSGTEFLNAFSELIFKLMGGMIVFFVIASGISIYSLVRYIQFLMRLKTAKDDTQDYHLQRAYKMELYSIVSALALVVILPILFVLLFIPLVNGGSGSYGAIIGGFMLIMVLILIAVLLPIILQIVAGVALATWAENLSMHHPENYPLRKMSDGINNIKLGRILSVIPMVQFIGPYVVIYGFWTGGKAIMNVYGQGGTGSPSQSFDMGNMGQQTTTPHGQPQATYGTPSMPSHVTTAPKSSNICPYCGTPKANLDAAFCSVCGKEMR